VNFFYGIPHFCVSIALRVDGEIVVGVIHDPMVGETWTVEKGGPAMLNGVPIQASKRDTFEQSILFVGCGKDEEALRTGIERFHKASLRARKMRMMGSAALGMAYIACGRLDAYIESRISLWDIAAGQLLVETAGGKVDLTPVPATPTPGPSSPATANCRLKRFSEEVEIVDGCRSWMRKNWLLELPIMNSQSTQSTITIHYLP
jgi:myo-inositol-1(or 4)-monophosphatase